MPTAAEFFAGIGLMRMGLEHAGWEVTFANDISEKKRRMYEGHFGPCDHFAVEDIHCLHAAEIPDVNLVTASFPCTDLSLAGAREGLSGPQSSAFWGFTRLLREMGPRRPRLVLIENVPGFLTSHDGKDFQAAMLELNSLGYGIDAMILDAAWFVPQSRERLFIMGVLDPHTPIDPPLPITSPIRPRALVKYILQHSEIRWRLNEVGFPCPATPPLAAMLEDLPDDAPEWWNRERAGYMLNQMSERHRAVAERMIAGDQWSYGTVFRRMRKGRSMAELRSDGIAGCLRTPKGGSAKQILFRGGRGGYAVRWLTPNECANLMGANGYNITVPADEAYFGFGDAVCVSVVEWVTRHVIEPAHRALNA